MYHSRKLEIAIARVHGTARHASERSEWCMAITLVVHTPYRRLSPKIIPTGTGQKLVHSRAKRKSVRVQVKHWSVYIIRCRDSKLYTGISNDVEHRVAKHNEGKGCKFTKSRHPVKLVYKEDLGTQSAARKRELEIQSFTRTNKLNLINGLSGAIV